ncbi:MAG: hypothetical protein IPK19_18210 [Chloroflexi bacterium]|nr:hypothetical protein [Chloroflexota bacterium]
MATSTALLRTKFFVPSIQTAFVRRKRLVDRLAGSSARPLTLISAAAGSGKTSVLRDWIETTRPVVAWLSLDESDNDPTRFWAHVIGALQTVFVSIGDSCLNALRAPRQAPLSALLTMLLNDAAALPAPITLVLDDYYVITEKAIHDSLSFLLEHLPPSLRLIISTRMDPLLPLGRMRARGLLAELRDSDLRFTHDEAAQFLNEVMDLDLSAEEVVTLDRRTEGWIVGLQMAALSLQHFDDEAGRSQFIHDFAGNDRYVLDYLMGEVLQQQPPDVQRFLLDTSILDRLSGALCNAVTERADSQAVLEGLEAANLFLIPLDNRRAWYRYHHLFADLLRHQLNRGDSGRAALLHRRASQWYEAAGLAPQAVDHAIAGADLTNAVRLIKTVERAMLMMHGEPYTMLRWIRLLPADAPAQHPELHITHAWALVGLSQPDEAWRVLQAAREALGPDLPVLTQAEIAMVAATIGVIKSDIGLIMEYAPVAVALTPETYPMERSFALWMMGQFYRFQGDAVRAEATFADAARLAEQSGTRFVATLVASNRADRMIEQGRLREGLHAHRQLQARALHESRHPLFIVGDSFIWSAWVMLEWNDLDGAEADVARGLEINQNVLAEATIIGGMIRALIAAARGEFHAIPRHFQEALHLAEAHHLEHMSARLGAYQAWCALRQGHVDAALRWLRSIGYAESAQGLSDGAVLLIVARVLIAAQRVDEAIRLLSTLRADAEKGGRFKMVVETLVIEAVGQAIAGRTAESQRALNRALALAEPEDYVRVFLDEGAPMEALLQQARRQHAGQDTLGRSIVRLLGAFGAQRSPVERPAGELIAPLSDRETEILRLLAQGCSNAEIGDRLYLSVNTVKTHMKRIYEKLDVKSRVEAAERARDLRLL